MGRFALLAVFLFAATIARGESSAKLPLPPFSNGGIRGLWAQDHEYIQKKFGTFELLDYSDFEYRVRREGMTDTTWKLVAMGNFLPKGIQFATLARLQNRSDGLLLIMFDWLTLEEAKQSTGVFYTSFLSKEKLLLRTKQTTVDSGTDTLLVSCGDTESLCGKAYFDSKSNQVVYRVVGSEPSRTMPSPKPSKKPSSPPPPPPGPETPPEPSGSDNPWE